MTAGRPWVHAKWAMTLDGRIASRTGHSKWITNEQSRAEVHRLRGRMDALITGSGTVRADDPQLTVRPSGVRTPMRVVLDSTGTSVHPDSQLIRTLDVAPVLLATSAEQADSDHVQDLAAAGVQVLPLQKQTPGDRVAELLQELGRRQCTNVLLECGGRLMGQFFDAELVDELHVFVAPKIVGGQEALSPVGGLGLEQVRALESLTRVDVQRFGNDVLIRGRLTRSSG
jgi:diaminohydroxyphosphoribosylaminopyrimidine deaminase/5-amino-6-(5-phosphoribosylamino)uracil reductase